MSSIDPSPSPLPMTRQKKQHKKSDDENESSTKSDIIYNDDYTIPEIGTGNTIETMVLSPYEIYRWMQYCITVNSHHFPALKKYIIPIATDLKIRTTGKSFYGIIVAISNAFSKCSISDRKNVCEIINKVHRRFMMIDTTQSKKDDVLRREERKRVLQVRLKICSDQQLVNNHEMWATLISSIEQVYQHSNLPYVHKQKKTQEENMITVVKIYDDENDNDVFNRWPCYWKNVFSQQHKTGTHESLISVTYRPHRMIDQPVQLPVVHIYVIKKAIDYLELHMTIMCNPLFLMKPGSPEKQNVLQILTPITLKFEFAARHPLGECRKIRSRYDVTGLSIEYPESIIGRQLSLGEAWPLKIIDDHDYDVGQFEVHLDDLLNQLDAAIFRKTEIEKWLPLWITCLPTSMFPIICSFLAFP
jgi:hypothetical protein